MGDAPAAPVIGDLSSLENRVPDVVTDVGGPVLHEFEIEVPDGAEDAWVAANKQIMASVIPLTNRGHRQSKKLGNDQPVYMWKSNQIKRAGTPLAYKEQWLIMELNGTFVHLHHQPDGVIRVIVAAERLI